MQFFDLRNLNYYCDAKGHLEQPVSTFLIRKTLNFFYFFSRLPCQKSFLTVFLNPPMNFFKKPRDLLNL